MLKIFPEIKTDPIPVVQCEPMTIGPMGINDVCAAIIVLLPIDIIFGFLIITPPSITDDFPMNPKKIAQNILLTNSTSLIITSAIKYNMEW